MKQLIVLLFALACAQANFLDLQAEKTTVSISSHLVKDSNSTELDYDKVFQAFIGKAIKESQEDFTLPNRELKLVKSVVIGDNQKGRRFYTSFNIFFNYTLNDSRGVYYYGEFDVEVTKATNATELSGHQVQSWNLTQMTNKKYYFPDVVTFNPGWPPYQDVEGIFKDEKRFKYMVDLGFYSYSEEVWRMELFKPREEVKVLDIKFEELYQNSDFSFYMIVVNYRLPKGELGYFKGTVTYNAHPGRWKEYEARRVYFAFNNGTYIWSKIYN